MTEFEFSSDLIVQFKERFCRQEGTCVRREDGKGEVITLRRMGTSDRIVVLELEIYYKEQDEQGANAGNPVLSFTIALIESSMKSYFSWNVCQLEQAGQLFDRGVEDGVEGIESAIGDN